MAGEIAYKPSEDYKDVSYPEVPVTPQIVRNYSLNEILALKGNLLILQSTNVDAGVNPTFYTVPVGYVFFIVSGSMNSTQNHLWAAGDARWFVYLNIVGNGTKRVMAHGFNAKNNVWSEGNTNSSLSPTIPLAIQGGSYFYVYQQASLITTEVCLQGYLIENKEIPQVFG